MTGDPVSQSNEHLQSVKPKVKVVSRKHPGSFYLEMSGGPLETQGCKQFLSVSSKVKILAGSST